MGSRRKGREVALQCLYLKDVTTISVEKAFRGVTWGLNLEDKTTEFSQWLTKGTLENRPQIDELIIKYTKNWELNRMACVDRNILRMGTFELLHALDTPVSVIIDEAVEIAKMYSTKDSGKFVNGILDKVKLARKESQSQNHVKK